MGVFRIWRAVSALQMQSTAIQRAVIALWMWMIPSRAPIPAMQR